ncbi:MAG: tetratricopeptide repeat protein [Desulfovibrionaceae bacterium]|nr:tetratricopeptide repeat protein [Desulfovibrionaceae bacterium]
MHIAYTAPQAEYISIPIPLRNNIYKIEEQKKALIFHVHKSLSKSEQGIFQSKISKSSFVRRVRYTASSIILEMNTDALGYVFIPSSDTLTLFYDSTRKASYTSRNRNTVDEKDSSQKSFTVLKSDASSLSKKQDGIARRIGISPAAGKEKKAEPKKENSSVNQAINSGTNGQVIVPRKEIPDNAMRTYIRERVHTGEETTPQSLERNQRYIQTTERNRIDKGELEKWNTEQNSKATQVSLPVEKSIQQVAPIQEQSHQKESEKASNSDEESNNIHSIRERIARPSLSEEQVEFQDKNNQSGEKEIQIDTTIQKPVPANENTALVADEDEKKEDESFETQRSVINSLLNREEYEKALVLLKNLSEKIISKPEKEEILYLIAEVSEVLSRTKPEYIVEAINNFTIAMNFDLQSKNVPNALLQLGLLNGTMKNTKEIEAYFSIIRTKYPNNKNVPLTYYYLGKYYQDNKQYSKALVQYKTLEEKYPQFEFLREVIVSIIQCLDSLGYYNDIKPYIAFIDARWPTLYQVYPDILLAKAKVYFDLKEYSTALDSYWQYVNIIPKATNIDMIYSRIGDSYLHLGEVEKARAVYKNIVQNYKDTEGYVLAKIRLAEDLIIDDITDDSQFLSVFDRSYTTTARDTYKEILESYAQSSFAPIAKAKLALWYFWMKDYKEALLTADSFRKEYPNDPLIPSIHMLLGRILNSIAEDSTTRKEIPTLWKKYAHLFTEEGSLAPEYRLHIAQALADENEDEQANEVLRPFFQGRRYKDISEQAISVALDIYKKTKDWKATEDLYYRVLDWDLSRDIYARVIFSTAIAFEHMGEYDKSDTLFQRLLSSVFTPPYYRGVSAYYVAKNGLKALQPPARVYPFAQESLNSLLLASKEKEAVPGQGEINDDIIRSLIQLREITKDLGSTEETLRYTVLQEQYEPQNILLQIEKAKLIKEMGNREEWKRILEGIIQKDPASSYAKLARMELIGEQNRNSLKELNK